ncbi:hypothetical protein ACFV20_13275 [Streptomyces sp. NPDC059696]
MIARPSRTPFRLAHLAPCAEAASTWLHDAAEVVDPTHLTPAAAVGPRP